MSSPAAPRVMAKAKGKKKVKAKKAKVKVVLRVRPQLGEVELAEEPCVEVSTETIQSQKIFLLVYFLPTKYNCVGGMSVLYRVLNGTGRGFVHTITPCLPPLLLLAFVGQSYHRFERSRIRICIHLRRTVLFAFLVPHLPLYHFRAAPRSTFSSTFPWLSTAPCQRAYLAAYFIPQQHPLLSSS